MAGLKTSGSLPRALVAFAMLVAVLLVAGCNPTLDVVATVRDRLAQANFEYGTKTLLTGQKYEASVAVRGSTVYVLYFDSAARQLLIVKSSDGGKSWGSPYVVDSISDFYNASNNLVVDQNHLYICYFASRGAGTDYFVELTDNGSTFTASNFQAVSTYSSYPYGYENSIAFDNTSVYIVYTAGGAPVYTYAAKGVTMTFLAQPIPIDASFPDPAGSNDNRKPSSLWADGTKVNVCYADNVKDRLRIASFPPSGSGLPMTVNDLAIGGAVPTYSPSLSMNGPTLVAYYDGTAKSLRCYEHYQYIGPAPFYMLYTVSKAITVDASSTDVGRSCKLLFSSSSSLASIAYYDTANKQLKFAKGQQNHALTPPDFEFTSSVVDTVGGANFDCSLATDGSNFYLVYYDSTGAGALKIAKSADGGATW